MTGFDIQAALAAAPQRKAKACKVQRMLDEIPDDHPDKHIMVELATTNGETSVYAATVFANLGLGVANATILMHRAKTCPCYV